MCCVLLCCVTSRYCVKYLGAVGGEWPTLQRGHWFPSPGDVETFRGKMTNLCRRNDKGGDKVALLTEKKRKKYKLSVGFSIFLTLLPCVPVEIL